MSSHEFKLSLIKYEISSASKNARIYMLLILLDIALLLFIGSFIYKFPDNLIHPTCLGVVLASTIFMFFNWLIELGDLRLAKEMKVIFEKEDAREGFENFEVLLLKNRIMVLQSANKSLSEQIEEINKKDGESNATT